MKLIPTFFVLSMALVCAVACEGESGRSGSFAVSQARRDTAMIDSVPSCSSCQLLIIDSIGLGKTNDKLIPVRPPEFLRDSRGQFYLTFNYWADQPILRYDPTGAYVGRVGASGRGPGEYEMSTAVLLDAFDSLFVFESAGLLGHVYALDGKYVRRADVKSSRPFSITRSSMHRILALRTETWPPKDAAQYVIRFDEHGEPADSFAVFAPSTGRNRTLSLGKQQFAVPQRLQTRAYAAQDGSVWTLALTNYRLEQHDTNGTPRKLFGVRVAGEPDPLMSANELQLAVKNGRLVAEYSRITSAKAKRSLRPENWVDIDTSGLLWVARQIPAPSWDTISPARQVMPNSEAPEEENLSMDVRDRLYHTLIEIIDPRAGTLLARLTLPFMAQRVSAGFVGRVTANEDGYLLPTVYHLKLQRN